MPNIISFCPPSQPSYIKIDNNHNNSCRIPSSDFFLISLSLSSILLNSSIIFSSFPQHDVPKSLPTSQIFYGSFGVPSFLNLLLHNKMSLSDENLLHPCPFLKTLVMSYSPYVARKLEKKNMVAPLDDLRPCSGLHRSFLNLPSASDFSQNLISSGYPPFENLSSCNRCC